MQIVAASRTRKFPVSVAWLITAPSPTVDRVLPRKWKYSATMLAFQAPPDAVMNPVIRYGKMAGQKQFPPALDFAQAEHSADFLQIRGNGAGAGDHIEQNVPLRSQQQQQHGANPHAAAHANQHQQDNREQSRGRHRGGDLRNRLDQGGELGPHAHINSHGDCPESRDHQRCFHAQEGGSGSAQNFPEFRARKAPPASGPCEKLHTQWR